MTTTKRPAVIGAAAVAGAVVVLSAAQSLAAGSTAAPSPYIGAAQPGSAAPGAAGYCKDDSGVTVVVDMSALGGGVTVRCAGDAGAGSSGLDALRSAGFAVTGTTRFGLSFVCRIQGRPAADEVLPIPGNDGYQERCVDTPPPTAFWGYWYAPNRGAWTYSSSGAQAHETIPGGFEGWAFALGGSSPPRPAIAPVRPAAPPPSTAPAPTTAPPSPQSTPPPPPTSTRPPTPLPATSATPTRTSPPTPPSSPPSTSPQSVPEPSPAPTTRSTTAHPATSSGAGAAGSPDDGEKTQDQRTSAKNPSSPPEVAEKTSAAPRSAGGGVPVSGELADVRSEDAGSPLATLLGAGVLVLLAGGVGLSAWRRSHRG
jgi:hypothetical protein